MPEPDFDQIARDLATHFLTTDGLEFNVHRIAEQLRQTWNARGAADRDVINAELDGMEGVLAATRAVQALDR